MWLLTRTIALLCAAGRALGELRLVLADLRQYLVGLATQSDARSYRCFAADAEGQSFRMLLGSPGHIEDALGRDGEWEPDVAQVIAFFMGQGGVFIDVGANIGYHSLRLAAALPAAQVFAFEPNPSVCAELRRNVRLSGVENVSVRECALADRAGTLSFYAQRPEAYNRGNSSLRCNPDRGRAFDEIEVRVARLDEVVDARTAARTRVIKIDTEGSEAAVLAGAQALIGAARPVIVLEFETRFCAEPRAALRRLTELLPAYSLWVLRPGARLARFDPTATPGRWFRADLICLPGSIT
jgi:FkbM family methyltransferase